MTKLQASVDGFLLPALQSQNTPPSRTTEDLETPHNPIFVTFSLKYLDDPADV